MELDLPLLVTAALLVLWGTGRNDSNVTFAGVIFVCAFVLVEAIIKTNGMTVTFSPEAIPSTDIFAEYFAGNQKSLATFLMLLFCFGFGAVGTAVFAFSPFLGELLYSAVVSALFRDVSVVGDPRVIVWACVLLSGALSEHIFRLNLAALVLACLFWERNVTFPQHGAFETVCFLNGLVFLTLHDIVVRFLLEPVKAIVEASFLGMTAFVMVDSALELGALPTESGAAAMKKVPKTPIGNLLRIHWTDSFGSGSAALDSDLQFRLALASPLLVSLFCMAYYYRTIRVHHAEMNWQKWQQVIGVGIGTAIGLHLWARYGGIHYFRLNSPITASWVSTALLFFTSTLLNASSGTTRKRDVWHQTYLKRAWFSKKSTSSTSEETKAKKSTPYPSLLLGSVSSTYPEVYDIAIRLEDEYYALDSNINKLRLLSTTKAPVDHAKQAFACAQIVSTLVKHCEDIGSRLEARIESVQNESQILARATDGPAVQKLRQRHHLLQQDLVGIQSYADQLRRELQKRDDEALNSLESALKVVSNKAKPSAPEEERKLKMEADELDSMCEAIRKRIKHRKKQTDSHNGGATTSAQNGSSSMPPPPSAFSVRPSSAAAEASALPIVPPNQSLFPSDRAEQSSPSPTKKGSSRRLLLFGRKKQQAAAPSSPPSEQGSFVDHNDRQSASSAGNRSGSGKKWSSFIGRRSSKNAEPPASPQVETPAAQN